MFVIGNLVVGYLLYVFTNVLPTSVPSITYGGDVVAGMRADGEFMLEKHRLRSTLKLSEI